MESSSSSEPNSAPPHSQSLMNDLSRSGGAPAPGAPAHSSSSMQQVSVSALTYLGEEINRIFVPVSITMLLCVLLVRALMPHGSDNPNAVGIAQVWYKEAQHNNASSTEKFEGGAMNALIFVLFITAMTFVLFLLFKYRCTSIIWAYMAFAGFNVFFVLGGVVITQLLQRFNVAVDIYSLLFFLYNFAMAGVLSVFFMPAPLTLKQAYLVFVGVVVAFWFTKIPEWTTWLLLAAMAIYDLYAVLTPGGPLKVLVELAQERNEDLPALVYEARPMRGPPRGWGRTQRNSAPNATGAPASVAMVERRTTNSNATTRTPAVPAFFFTFMADAHSRARAPSDEERASLIDGEQTTTTREGRSNSGVMRWLFGTGENDNVNAGARTQWRSNPITNAVIEEDEGGGGGGGGGGNRGGGGGGGGAAAGAAADSGGGADNESDSSEFDLPDGIKLGLGDFIFYSVMVGRAAMTDMLTVFSSYLAIISGLGLTLLILAVMKKALPALPFSIALGILFYFATRVILEPFVVYWFSFAW